MDIDNFYKHEGFNRERYIQFWYYEDVCNFGCDMKCKYISIILLFPLIIFTSYGPTTASWNKIQNFILCLCSFFYCRNHSHPIFSMQYKTYPEVKRKFYIIPILAELLPDWKITIKIIYMYSNFNPNPCIVKFNV